VVSVVVSFEKNYAVIKPAMHGVFEQCPDPDPRNDARDPPTKVGPAKSGKRVDGKTEGDGNGKEPAKKLPHALLEEPCSINPQ
jgi:hypothetical protein